MEKVAGFVDVSSLFHGKQIRLFRAKRQEDKRPLIIKQSEGVGDHGGAGALRYEYNLIHDLKPEGSPALVGLEETDAHATLLLEDVPGRLLFTGKPMSVERFLHQAHALTRLVGRLHENGLIHGNLHPHSLLFNEADGRIHFLDLRHSIRIRGEARRVTERDLPEDGLGYISPEQTGRMNRPLDFRSDFYSLGAVFYSMLTGRPPFTEGDHLEAIHNHIARVPEPIGHFNPGVPEVLNLIIRKLMEKAPEDRYQSTYGVLHDLDTCLSQWHRQGTLHEFPLGEKDREGRFYLPRKLYGRRIHVARLREAFAHAGRGHAGLVLVSGSAGCGKTSLVGELEQEVVSSRAFFVRGDYGEIGEDQPLAALIAAARDLVRQVLARPETEITWLRRRLAETLGSSFQPLLEVVPELALITTGVESGADVQPANRIEYLRALFPAFFHCFGSEDRPLVLFLDDLHWADESSLTMIDRLIQDTHHNYLLIACTWRVQEEGDSRRLMHYIEQLQERGVPFEHMTLGNLERADVVELVADTFAGDRERAQAPATVVMERTQGNPFFVREFLKQLHRDKLVQFDHDRGRWSWDNAKLREAPVSSNLADLLVTGIRSLKPTTQYVLEYAACVGNPFDLERLSIACEMNPSACLDCLQPALEEGMIMTLDDVQTDLDHAPDENWRAHRFAFQHDRVRTAADSMMTSRLRQEAHLRLGRAELARMDDLSGPNIHHVVRHFSLAMPLIFDTREKEKLAALFLPAGQAALEANAFSTAVRHLDEGLRLLSPESWDNIPDTAYQLHLARGHCALALNRHNRARDLFLTLYKHDFHTPEVYLLGVRAAAALDLAEEAINLAREGLASLGFKLPNKVNRFQIQRELLLLRPMLVEDPPNLKAKTDPHQEAVIKLLMATSPVTYYARPKLWSLTVLQAARLSMHHGRADTTSVAFILASLFFGLNRGQWKQAVRLAGIGLRQSRKSYQPQARGRVMLCYGNIYPLIDHMPRAADYFAEGLRETLETGNSFQAGLCIIGILANNVASGAGLQELRQLQSKFLHSARRARESSEFMDMLSDWIAFLEQKPASDNMFAEEDMDLRIAGFRQDSQARFYLLRLIAAVFSEDSESAGHCIARLKAHANALTLLHPLYGLFQLCRGLTLVDKAGDKSTDRIRLRKQLRDPIAKLNQLAELCPINFAPYLNLLRAEEESIRGRRGEAVRLFDLSVKGFADAGFKPLEALAQQRAGRWYQAAGMETLSETLLTTARKMWSNWGGRLPASGLDPSGEALPQGQGRTADSQPEMDLTTMVKASQVISREIDLSRLLEKIMRFLLENAGARRGYLILRHEDRLIVEAEGDLQLRHIQVRLGWPLDSARDLSTAVVNYVDRTHEVLVLDDACRKGRFVNDLYIKKGAKRSIMCLPIMHQGALTAIVYLENDLVAGAFTPDRLALLSVLSGQVAISLENAGLYERLDEVNRKLAEKVEERTRALQESNRDLQEANDTMLRTREKMLEHQKMATLGAMASGIAHEIKNPLNLIDNFAAIINEDLDEALRLLETKEGNDAANAVLADLLAGMAKNARFIGLHGARINEITDAMLKISIRSTNRREPNPINVVLSEHADIAYRARRGAQSGNRLDFQVELDQALGRLDVVPEELGRALVNILNNAFEAAESLPLEETPRVRLTSNNLENSVEIRIRDNGPGIPQEIRDKVLQPFFTTKDESIGLGLAIAAGIVKNHEGTITITDAKPKGAEVIITLPK